MTKSLNDMSVTEAASKALELIAYGEYEKYYSENRTFEEYAISHLHDGDDEVYDSELEDYVPVSEMKHFDIDRVWQHFHSDPYKMTKDGLTAEVVKSHGGEGEGDQFWMVVSLSDGLTTRYFRKDGWYASYDGGYLDGDTSEVKPKEKLVTYYE